MSHFGAQISQKSKKKTLFPASAFSLRIKIEPHFLRDLRLNPIFCKCWLVCSPDYHCLATNVHLAIRVNLRCLKNGSNGSTMSQHLGIDTKIKSLTCLEPNLLFSPFYLTFTGQNVAILATQVNLVCPEMVSIYFPCPKTWG